MIIFIHLIKYIKIDLLLKNILLYFKNNFIISIIITCKSYFFLYIIILFEINLYSYKFDYISLILNILLEFEKS